MAGVTAAVMAIKAIKARLKLGLKRGIKGRSDGAGRNGSTASRGAERAARGAVARRGSAGAVGKMDPTSGVHTSARGEREGADDGRRDSKKKTYFAKYAKAGAAERLGPACGLRPAGEERASGAGWAEGRPGRKVGRAESKEKNNFRIKIGFLNLARLWKFVEEDLGGILT